MMWKITTFAPYSVQNTLIPRGSHLSISKEYHLVQQAYSQPMKPLPAPTAPGKTDSERFDHAVRKRFTVSKEEMQRRKAEWQNNRRRTSLPRERMFSSGLPYTPLKSKIRSANRGGGKRGFESVLRRFGVYMVSISWKHWKARARQERI